MALQAILNKPGVHRVILEEYPEGVYVLVYKSHDVPNWHPSKDNLQNDWDMAKVAALEDYGITAEQWQQIPDTHFNG